jgi:uncharacterized protein
MSPVDGTSISAVRQRLGGALTAAMKERDAVAVGALRSVLAAIDNAEAVDRGQAPPSGVSHARLAATVRGLGAGDVARRSLTDAELEAVVRGEVTERGIAAEESERAGQRERAEQLRREARLINDCLSRPDA